MTAPSVFNDFEIANLDAALERGTRTFDALHGASIFVTGGTGFVGQWLLALILRANATRNAGISLTVLTRDAANFSAAAPDLAGDPAVRIVEGDVRFFEFPKGRFTHVLHAATDTSLAADAAPLALMDTIVGGTRRALEFAAMAGARRFLLCSSGAIYGPQPPELTHIPEDHLGACPTDDRRSVYGQAKRYAEQLATVYTHQAGVQAVVARVFATLGPGLPLDAHFAIGNFIADAIAGRSIIIKSDGSPVRSYIYAADLGVWLLHLLAFGEAGRAYNVGSDEGFSLAEIARRVAEAIPGSNGFRVEGSPQPNAHRSRYVPAIKRARALGLDIWTPLDDAIRLTARHAERAQRRTAAPRSHRNEHAGLGKALTLVIDVDGVLASLTPGNDYTLATPLESTIAHVNRLYDAGHRIVLFTARGSATGIDWSELTQAQMAAWGVRYHELRFGKPAADYYVDDRLLSVGELARLAEAAR